MVLYKSIPNLRITTNYSGTSYVHTNQQFMYGQIIRVENGFDTATLLMTDRHGWSGSYNWLSKVAADEDIKIQVKDESESTWITMLDGIVRIVNLNFSDAGEVLHMKCDGAGYGFEETVCGEEYGAESDNASLDTLKEIITDASHGIVPKWVNSILGSANASGHGYDMTGGAANDLIEAIAGTINYLYYPYKPNHKCLNDLLELVQAIKGANAGPHWIVDTDDELMVTTIGSHHAAAVTNGWTTYYGGSAAASTLVQGTDFKAFKFESMAKEANYILQISAFRRPANGDIWTENNSGDWGTETDMTVADENGAGLYKINSFSIRGRLPNALDLGGFYYPSTADLNFDITKIGTERSVPQIRFYIQRDSDIDMGASPPFIELGTGAAANNDYYWKYLTDEIPSANTWYHVALPIGPYYNSDEETETEWRVNNNPDWADIDYVNFWAVATGNNADLYVDGLNFEGRLVRAAYEAGIGAANKLRVKVITDKIPKDDTLKAADDSGTIAQLAYAELLRSQTTPIMGYVITPLIPDLLPGQLMHIHAKQKRDGTFNIDKDMRVTKIIHHLTTDENEGCNTQIFLTDDVKNANCRLPYEDLNKALSAIRPEFQDLQATSIKANLIDITQGVLSKSY